MSACGEGHRSSHDRLPHVVKGLAAAEDFNGPHAMVRVFRVPHDRAYLVSRFDLDSSVLTVVYENAGLVTRFLERLPRSNRLMRYSVEFPVDKGLPRVPSGSWLCLVPINGRVVERDIEYSIEGELVVE